VKCGAVYAAQGDEGDVFPAQPFDTPTTDDTPGIGAENDLKERSPVDTAGPVLIVTVTPGKAAQLDFVLEEVMHRVLETARQELLLQIHRQEAGTGVDPLVTRHLAAPQIR